MIKGQKFQTQMVTEKGNDCEFNEDKNATLCRHVLINAKKLNRVSEQCWHKINEAKKKKTKNVKTSKY